MAKKPRAGNRTNKAPPQRGQIIPKGDSKWLIRIYVGRDVHKKRKYSSVTFSGTYGQAEKVRTKLLGSKDQGTFIAPSTQTVQEYVSGWLSGKVSLSEKTKTGYEDRMVNGVYPYIGQIRLDRLSRSDIQGLITKLHTKGLSRRTIQLTTVVLHGALKRAVSDGVLVRNPGIDLELPPKTHKESMVLNSEQIQKLLGHPSKHRALWYVLLTAGLRPQEALALTWADIDMVAGALSIRRAMVSDGKGKMSVGPTKNEGSVRVVMVPSETIGVLKAHRSSQTASILKLGSKYTRNDIVFAGATGGHLDDTRVRIAWKKDLETLELPKCRLYDARHSHFTLLLAGGVHPKIVSERAGHSNIQITMDTYSHVQKTMQQQASDVTGTLLFTKERTG